MVRQLDYGFFIAGLAAVLTLFFTGLEEVDPVVM